jgi:hypothetical protein
MHESACKCSVKIIMSILEFYFELTGIASKPLSESSSEDTCTVITASYRILYADLFNGFPRKPS